MFFVGVFPSEIFLLVLETREIRTILRFYDLFLLLFHNHSSLLTVMRKLLLSTDDLNSELIPELCDNPSVLLRISVCHIPWHETGMFCIAERNLGLRTCITRTHALLVESSVVQAYLYFLTRQKRNAWYEATGIYSPPRRCFEKERETGKLVVERKSSSMSLLLLMIKQQGQCGMFG